jgi:hypothetical protein
MRLMCNLKERILHSCSAQNRYSQSLLTEFYITVEE